MNYLPREDGHIIPILSPCNHLALRLNMRRIFATLAVVGALLFSAGSAWADFDDGVAAYERGDYATALQEWLPLGEQGDKRAQFQLGEMYAVGKGVVQDYAEAFKWFSMSSEPGHAVAQHWLGTLYMNGLGVPKNDAEAVKWFLEAAEQGFVESQHNLGYMYANGLSVPQNRVKAYMWALILKRNPGFDDPANALAASLDALEDQMTSTQISEARALADEWSEKHN